MNLQNFTRQIFRRNYDLSAIAKVLTSSSPEAIELFPADASHPTKFKLDEKIQLGSLIARQKPKAIAPVEIFNYGFRYLNVDEICVFVAIEDYGTVTLVRDRLNMRLVGSFCFGDRLWYYYSFSPSTSN